MRAAAIIVALIGVLLAAPSRGQTFNYPADGIVLQELYYGCTLGSTWAFFDSARYPELRQTLSLVYGLRDPEKARAAHQRVLERFPTAVVIRIRVGPCGKPA